LAAMVPLDRLAEIVSIGTLTAFIVVSAGVIVLRIQEPDLPRGFLVPGYPVTPILSIAACAYILISLHWYTWLAFSGWLSLALTYYLAYGRRHSALNADSDSVPLSRD
jgi:basic amino acid/polyamine antiporter, APA family